MTRTSRWRSVISLCAAALAAATAPAPAATLEILHSFEGGAGGDRPVGGVVLDGDGTLYGSTIYGGVHDWGTLYALSAGRFSALHEFGADGDGAEPQATLTIGADGTLWGTTFSARPMPGFGTVFSLHPDAGYAVRWRFGAGDGGNGIASGLALDKEGALYGVAMYGGDARCDCGSLFRFDPADDTMKTLHRFNGHDGANPQATPTLDGRHIRGSALYGGTTWVGQRGHGALYSTTRKGGQFAAQPPESGRAPGAGLARTDDGRLWTAVQFGGPGGAGALLRIARNGNQEVVHTFSSADRSGGALPGQTLLVGRDGMLYGTTADGGSDACRCGTLFRFDPVTLTLTTLHSFSAAEGYWPAGALVEDRSGRLYGALEQGGAFGFGSVFRFTP